MVAVKLVGGFLQKQKFTTQHTQSDLLRTYREDFKSQPLRFYPKFELETRRSPVVDLDALHPGARRLRKRFVVKSLVEGRASRRRVCA